LRTGRKGYFITIPKKEASSAWIMKENKTKIDGLVKSRRGSLRGVQRRSNPLETLLVMRLLRFTRNDKPTLFRPFTGLSKFVIQKYTTVRIHKQYNL
jgi:hypothetical protein